MTLKSEKLILFEFPDEVEIFLNYCQKNSVDPTGYLPVTLQPAARVYCKEKNLRYIDTLPFFNNDSHIRAVQESHRMTRLMEDNLEFRGDFPLEHTLIDTFIYYSRFYLNNYIRVLEVMRGIKTHYPDAEIYAVKKFPEPDGPLWTRWSVVPFLSKRDRFTAPIVELFCSRNGMPYTEIAEDPIKPPKKKSWVKVLLYKGVKKIARFSWKHKLKHLSKSDVVLFAASSYNLDRLGDDIKLRMPHTVCTAITQQSYSLGGYVKLWFKRMKGSLRSIPLQVFDTGPRKKKNPMLNQLIDSYRTFMEKNRSAFTYDGCALVDEFNKKVEADLLVYLFYLCRLARGQKMILENLKPSAVISPVSIEYYQSWGEICKNLSIPTLVIPQKGLMVPGNEYARIEEYHIGKAQVTDDFDYAASQSTLTSKYLKWSNYKGKLMETANLIFSKVDITKREDKRHDFFVEIGDERKIIVYAPSMKSRKSCRFYVLETLDELLSSISDVLNAVAKLPDTHLIMRIHPGEPITRKEIESLLTIPENVTISDKGKFEDVLSIADLVVSFSSTIIQEALVNGIPVALYDKWKRYNHLDAPTVDKNKKDEVSATYYIDNPGKLSESLRWIIDRHEHANRSFYTFKDYVFPSRYAETFFDFIRECFRKKNC